MLQTPALAAGMLCPGWVPGINSWTLSYPNHNLNYLVNDFSLLSVCWIDIAMYTIYYRSFVNMIQVLGEGSKPV